MFKMLNELTQERLRQVLHYNPDSGEFTWAEQCGGSQVGRRAGYRKNGGYWAIRVDGIKYFAHRLAWLYMTGEFPRQYIDHINRVRGDDRWANLRDVSHAENMGNRSQRGSGEGSKVSGPRPPRRYGTTVCVRYRPSRNRWEAYCHIQPGKYFHLGTYKSKEAALAAPLPNMAERQS